MASTILGLVPTQKEPYEIVISVVIDVSTFQMSKVKVVSIT